MREYTTDQLAERIRVSPRTVEKWRRDGKGPAFHRKGTMVLYRERDVEAWLDACTRGSTREEDAQEAREEATVQGLLREILDELRGIRASLDRGRSAP